MSSQMALDIVVVVVLIFGILLSNGDRIYFGEPDPNEEHGR